MRLDVFLWRARFFKARTSATEAIEDKGARIERDGQVRRIDKPATPVEAGDVLAFTRPIRVEAGADYFTARTQGSARRSGPVL